MYSPNTVTVFVDGVNVGSKNTSDSHEAQDAVGLIMDAWVKEHVRVEMVAPFSKPVGITLDAACDGARCIHAHQVEVLSDTVKRAEAAGEKIFPAILLAGFSVLWCSDCGAYQVRGYLNAPFFDWQVPACLPLPLGGQ